MKLTQDKWLYGACRWMRRSAVVAVLMAVGLLGQMASAQAINTTTVQGTVYLANGQASAGTLHVSWPAFTTANGQSVVAGSMTVKFGSDGFVSVNLAPNLGAMPAGLFYTAVFYLSDGSTSTQYWVVPAAAQASLAQVQSQLMPATQAVQAVSRAYVDQAIAQLGQGVFTSSGGTLTGPLYLNGDPTQALQAADKHYVDAGLSQVIPLTGGAATGLLTAKQLGAAYQVDQFAGADFGAKLQACLNAVNAQYGGSCDARNFTGNLSMGSNLTIATANTTVQLPCATITTASQVIVTAGTRNVSLRGCALRGGTQASGSRGGTVFAYSGAGAMVQIGDPLYAMDTQGFHMDNAVINTTASTSATAQGLAAYRTQEMNLESLYLLGNQNQTGMTLDGTGNYTGGSFYDNTLNGFQTAVNAIGHQVANAAITDWMNASTFVRLHINCPTSGGSPIAGTYGINLQQGDGNTFTGGDVEGCATALHLGANAQNNTIVGLRNENSTSQVVADAGSAYNNWITGGTMFTGKLTDNGTRNSFLDTFHRSFNGMNGDWYGSQQDATVTNHFRVGTGTGNERGLLDRYQTDYGYRWTMGLSDATGGEQYYQVLDELNNVNRLSIGQYNHGQASTNNQTVINAAGTGAVVLNGSNNAGTGGLVVGSGGSSATAVATINNAGNAQFNGTLQVGGTSTFTGTTSVKNQADAEVDQVLWAGATSSQKEALTYKDWNGTSQWYAMKDASNNWALNSATGGLDSFKAYQSTNSGDTYVNAAKAAGVVRVNYESGAGTAFKIYGGNSSSLYASFAGTTTIQFPGLAAGSGRYCLQIDNSGYVTNTGSPCGTGSSQAGSGTINSANLGQIAYYTTTGAVVGGLDTVPLTAGGTGSATAAGALQNLGGVSVAATTQQTLNGALGWLDPAKAKQTLTNMNGQGPVVNVLNQGVVAGGTLGSSLSTDTANTAALQAAINLALVNGGELYFPCGVYNVNGPLVMYGFQSIPMVGQSWACAIIQYTGTTDVTQGMLTVASAAPSTNCTSVGCDHTTGAPPNGSTGFRLENLALVGNVHVPDILDLLAGSQFHIRDVVAIGAGNADIYCQTCQQGQIDVPLLSWNALWGVGNYISYKTPNGIVMDGYSTPASLSNVSNHVQINSMTANGFSGKALWLRGSTQNTFSNCQISTSTVSIQIDTATGDTFTNCMSEPDINGAGAAVNLSAAAGDEVFIGSAMYGAVNIAGNGNQFIGGSVGATVISSGAHSNLFDGVGVKSNGSNITDNSPDTRYRELFDISTGKAVYNFPQSRFTPQMAGGGEFQTGILFMSGSWAVNNETVNIDPMVLSSVTSAWSAIFTGEWQSASAGSENVPTTMEFTASAPRMVLGTGETVTISAANGGHLQLTSSGGGGIYFSGMIQFFPAAHDTYAHYARPVSAPSVNAVSTDGAIAILNAQSSKGSRRIDFSVVALTDGTPSHDLAGFAAYDDLTGNDIPIQFGGGGEVKVTPLDNPDYPGCQGCMGIGVDQPQYKVDADGDVNISGSYRVGDAVVIPNTALGDHGSNGKYVQMSDGTGASGSLAAYAPDGSVSIGPTPPAGSIVGTTDTQTLTNKSIAASEINSGTLSAAQMPALTGDCTSAAGSVATTCTKVNGGSMPASAAALATNTSGQPIAATVAGAGAGLVTGPTSGTVANNLVCENGTNGQVKDCGVSLASPGAIAPTTVTASGLVTGGNDTIRTTSATIATTGFTSTGLVLPTVPVSTTKTGRCVVYWQMSSTSYTATFGIGMSSAPTGLWGGTRVTYAAAGTSNWLAFSQTATAATAVSTAATAGATGTTYRAEMDFTVQTGATNPVALTVYGEVSNAGATLSIQPGSACTWLP